MSKPIEEDSVARRTGWNAFGVERLNRIPPAPDYHIKMCGDDETLDLILVPFVLEMTDSGSLIACRAYITTVGSSAVEVGITNLNGAVNMLATNITIDTGEKSSRTASTPPVIAAEPDNEEQDGDQIEVTMLADGGVAMGLAVALWFAS